MSLRNFHVDANITDAMLLARSEGLMKNLVSVFRQAAANGCFKIGSIEIKDPDLNKVHDIVNEIDSRRLFYECGQDECPKHAMTSLYEVRKEIRTLSRGVWSDRSLERLVQEITAQLNSFSSHAEKLNPESLSGSALDNQKFWFVLTDMRISIWILVTFLKKKLGSILQPRNLPPEIELMLEPVAI